MFNIIREIQSKTTKRYYYIHTRMTKIKKTNHTSVGDDIKELELSYTASVNTKMVQHFGKQFDSLFSFFFFLNYLLYSQLKEQSFPPIFMMMMMMMMMHFL